MSKTTPNLNKALVLRAFDTFFSKLDYPAETLFWSGHHIQHNAHIAPGSEGLFELIRTLPDTLRYENQLVAAEGDYVIALADLRRGSQPTSRASKTASWPSIGMSCRRRQPKLNPSVACSCKAIASRLDPGARRGGVLARHASKA